MDSLPPGVDPSTIPLAKNPNGDPSNFDNPPSLEHTFLGLGIAMTVIGASCLSLRLITNFKISRKLGIDDYLCFFGLIGGIAYWAIVNSLAQDGASRHTWDVPATIVTASFIKRQFVQQMIIAPATFAAKASIPVLYMRIFPSVKWLRLISYVLIVFMFLFYGSYVVIAAVYCIPRGGHPWDTTALSRCESPVAFFIVIGTFSVVADIILLVLPFPIIYKLQLDQRKKVGLSIVFLVGFLTIVTSVTGLAYRVKIFLGNDPIWNGIEVAITTFTEVFGTVIVSCAPAIYTFWLKVFPKTKLHSSIRATISSRKSQVPTEYSVESQHKYDSRSSLKNSNVYNVLDDDVSGRSEEFHKTNTFAAGTNIPMRDMDRFNIRH